MMSESMEQEGKEVLRRLVQAGYEAYFVGGCVRDKLIGKPLKDIDIATSALPETVLELFERTVPTGLAHGTVTVLMERHPFEVTTFRKESEYEQYRRPKEVEFISDLNEDLRRRDFTINAMALAEDGRIIDPFGGQRDLVGCLIRAVGDPLERFGEDALRMLRGIRFACEYGFGIEDDTWEALVDHAPLLVHVAMERVYAELTKMIAGSAPDRAIDLLAQSRLPDYFKESVGWPSLTRGDTDRAVWRLAELDDPELRWTGLLARLGLDASQAKQSLKRLTFPGKKSEHIVKLLQADEWMERSRWRETDGGEAGYDLIARAAVSFGKSIVRDWLTLAAWRYKAETGALAGEPHAAAFLSNASLWLERVPVERVQDLAIDGSELVRELDKPPGPWLGQLLGELLLLTAGRRLPNEREALAEQAKFIAKRDTY
ncbi:CCA tRNA nucleotidyltransferase [Paenibacillus hodogayensis]|uniref:CCA tRNA nucleotidyltransferase n=1 Tax=Paenibacillus hodogayensis TaxID=279208 RepID=A0ABV5W4J4_9BACL